MFPALDKLVRMLTTLPGIGERSALRIAFHVLKNEELQAEQLSQALLDLRRNVHFCSDCGGLSESAGLCEICSNPARDAAALCVVEEPGDIFAIEKTGEFQGLYHVLMGSLSPLDGVGPEDLRLSELEERVRNVAGTSNADSDSSAAAKTFSEIFIATNPTLEGDATAHYIHERLRDTGIRVTRISHGIPTGASIEYADRSTLARSIRARMDI
ncbi:MAG: recombination mediator RecR [bacterium]|nr:recombination mediator RecR [bacterium]